MSQQQITLKNPKSGKLVTISRDAAFALQAQQESFQQEMKKLTESIQQKRYFAESRNIKIALQFDETGRINEFSGLQIELTKEIDNAQVQTALQEFMLVINQALTERENDAKAKLELITKKYEAQKQQVA